MGCLLVGVAALLALAVPASIAPRSLIGAYVVIALLALSAVAVVTVAGRRRVAVPIGPLPKRSKSMTRIAVLVVLYAVLVTVIHVLT